MFKRIFVYFAFLGLISEVAFASHFMLDAQIKEGDAVEFLKFEGPGAFDSYLTMNLPFEPMKYLLDQVQGQEQLKLKNRGEAHITVVTPVEYRNILRPRGISMAEINELAESMGIQSSGFETICLGRGSVVINEELEHTFFIVVTSEDLLNIRRAVQRLLVSKGGELEEFIPTNYYPHITVGFTSRDLHESDGVIKDRNSCIGDIEIFD